VSSVNATFGSIGLRDDPLKNATGKVADLPAGVCGGPGAKRSALPFLVGDFFSRRIFSISISIFLIFCCLSIPVVFSEEPVPPSKKLGYDLIAPAFGEMLANQVFENYRVYFGSVLSKSKSEKLTILLKTNDNGVLALDILSSIQKKAKHSIKWRRFEKRIMLYNVLPSLEQVKQAENVNGKNASFDAVLFEEKKMEEWDRAITGPCLWIDLLPESEAKEFKPVTGREVIGKWKPFELEFVKDSKGRQYLSLDDINFQDKIFERVVERGMNPVSAHKAVKEFIQAFRSNGETLVIFTGKKPNA
jgi:hypothetical protein